MKSRRQQWVLRAAFLLLFTGIGKHSGNGLCAEQLEIPRVLYGHTSHVESVAFSPDSKTLASGGYDGTVRLWDMATGKNTATWKGHAHAIHAVAFSPDGKIIASASQDRKIKLRNATTGENMLTLRGHTHTILAVTFSPDGKSLASGGLDSLKLWDVITGAEKATLPGHSSEVRSVTFSPDGKTLGSAGTEAVKFWDVARGKEKATWRIQGTRSITYSPDGKTLAAACATKVKFWDVAAGKEQANSLNVRVHTTSVAFSADGKKLATGCYDKTVKVWDTASGKLKAVLWGHSRTVNAVAFSPNGKMLASGSADTTVRLWKLPAKTPPDRIVGPGSRSLAEGAIACRTEHGGSVTISSDWKVWASRDGRRINLWRPATGRPSCSIQAGNDDPWGIVTEQCFNPDGTLLAAGTYNGHITLWDITRGRQIALLRGHGVNQINSLAFSPDGKLLASAAGCFDDSGRSVKVWDVATHQSVATFETADDTGFASIAFSPDGKTLGAACDDKTVRLWSVATQRPMAVLRGHTDLVRTVCFSPDGRTLASTCDDKTVRLWELATGKERATLRGHTEWVFAVAFSPDGKTLASGGGDNTVRLWDTGSGKEIARLEGHTGSVHSVTFNPDGKTLASSGDETTRFWNLEPALGASRPGKAVVPTSVVETLWAALGEADAKKAYRGMQGLLTAPDQAVLLVKNHLRPIPEADARRLAQLVVDLDARSFVIRQQATQTLESFGELAEPALRKRLLQKPSLEVCQRIEQLLTRLELQPLPPEAIRMLRAVEVLEHVGTGEARQVLECLATGAEGARLTREAKASLIRLKERRTSLKFRRPSDHPNQPTGE